MRHLYSLLLLGLLMASATASAQVTVANSGFWSDPATWSTGALPTASDDVVIEDSTVTIDIDNAVARNVTVSGEGLLRTNRGFEGNVAVGLTVFGDLTIVGPDAELLPLSNQDENGVGYGEVYHRLTVHGDIDNSTGGSFDMRRGSTSTTPETASYIDLIFAGDEDATMTLGPYDSNSNQLFRTEVAKTNGARIILGSDATVDNNSRAQFTLTSGIMDTGDFKFVLISNNSQIVQGGSPASYVIGELARGLPKGTVSSQTSRFYPVGGENGYRPVNVYVTDRSTDDQYFGVRTISGDADTGSSTLEGGLMEVSPNRYFAFQWYFFDSADPITIDRVEISYGSGDSVPEGSSDFVVASSIDDRATWTNADGFDADGVTDHVTTLASPPTYIQSADLTGWTFTFDQTTFLSQVYYAAVGTSGSFTAIEGTPVAGAFELTAAPNPASGATSVSFVLPEAQDATVEVFDVLGRRVATLLDGPVAAGESTVTWNAAGNAPGVYVLRLTAGTQAAVQTVTLTR